MPGGWSQGEGLLTWVSPLVERACPETQQNHTRLCDSGLYPTLSITMPRTWAWVIVVYVG